MLEIVNVLPGGRAGRLGLEPGDAVLSVNGHDIGDVIDFRFYAAEERIALAVRKAAGEIRKFSVTKDPDDTLGLEFCSLSIKRCRNKCIFCFVDQIPRGCRSTLYVKDDDFRASFLYGNFITLGALTEPDWERIFRQRLSPLYISVHATDPVLRASMLRNKKAPPILDSLKRLAAGGISMHTQIVLCPDINDGERLMKTISDLAGLFPSVLSVAVVPVGLTAYRRGLHPLRTFTRREARAVLTAIEAQQRQFRKRFGTSFVFASDEFYIKANVPVPPASFYEDFPQIENGVGMVAAFLREASRTRLPAGVKPIKATVVTGVSFGNILPEALKRLAAIRGASVRSITVENRFFGPSVTVTGLLAGSDILRALRGKRLGDVLLVPANALKEDEDVFLDNMSLDQLGLKLKVRTMRVEGFSDIVKALRDRGRNRT